MRFSPATVISCIALAVALGGTSYAAVSLPANSVGTAQLKTNAVVSIKVKDGSLLRKDFKAGQVPAGPAGPAGAAGPAGPAGSAGPAGPAGMPATVLWAVVNADGTTARSKGFSSSSKIGTGMYNVVFNVDVSQCSELAAIGPSSNGFAAGDIDVASLFGNAKGLYIETRDSSGTLTDKPFHVAVFC